ncbi:sensor histidine kinase [Actinoplanes sp. M2I2]|uniref:sensor histidine kinase n=1 Tax=Actinoplanes sp. M2I2 TaxID=1734444 RepID=UPI0020201A03|nr:histidine kinase [Actinoplanes sp. M2I2]
MRVRDLAVPVALAAAGLATLPVLNELRATDRPVDAVAVVLVAATAAVTLLRHRWPGAALLTAAATTSAYLIIGFPYGPILLAFAVCVYAVARARPLRQAAAWAVPALVVLLLHLFQDPLSGLAPGAAWVVVPFTIGAARRQVADARARERAESERRAADAERLRVAHEVHDVVGHGLAAIQMQADIALHLRDTRPEMAHEALAAISSASAEALAELRATLAGLSPEPGPAQIDDLVTRVRAAGVDVDLVVAGTPAVLPPAAYRVLQEALTNVVKHGSARRARVAIDHRTECVDLSVSNPAPGRGHDDGFGITGMRRRVERAGGTLSAGAADGVFTVHALVPRELRP